MSIYRGPSRPGQGPTLSDQELTTALVRIEAASTLASNSAVTATGSSVTAANSATAAANSATAAANSATSIIGSPAASSKKIAVLGDSLSYQGADRLLSWPTLLQHSLQSMGSDAKVINLAVSGHSFYKTNTVASFGGKTALQQCIAAAPDIILVALGANDAIIKVDGRSLAQVKDDASSALTALRSALPAAKIIYISEQCHDASNFAATSIKNKGVVPAFFSLSAGGVLAGSYCPEVLDNYIDAGVQAAFADWGALDVFLKSQPFNGVLTMNLFKVARLGCTMPDGLHPTSEGLKLLHAQVLDGLSSLTAVTTLIPELAVYAGNIVAGSLQVFSAVLTASGDGYTSNVSASNGFAEKIALENVPIRGIEPDSWFYPYKTSLWAAPFSGSIAAKTPILFVMTDGPPNAPVSLSLNGTPFGSIGISTDSRGRLWFPNTYALLGVPAGTYSIRYKVGNSVSANAFLTVNA